VIIEFPEIRNAVAQAKTVAVRYCSTATPRPLPGRWAPRPGRIQPVDPMEDGTTVRGLPGVDGRGAIGIAGPRRTEGALRAV